MSETSEPEGIPETLPSVYHPSQQTPCDLRTRNMFSFISVLKWDEPPLNPAKPPLEKGLVELEKGLVAEGLATFPAREKLSRLLK